MKPVDVCNIYVRNNIVLCIIHSIHLCAFVNVDIIYMKRFLLTSTYNFSDYMRAWHTSGMMVDIAGTDIRNICIRIFIVAPCTS